MFTVSPTVCLYHVTSTLAETTSGLEKLSVTSHVFASIVAYHFQGLVEVR